ncbi:transcription factor MYC2-like [Oryza brachyantha]|uniref:transcription factor MYC2-like n=1 Tax=Oryza brachyantha TaxID=4533 RepID=UPI001ADC4F36|nr:transcription factor MYC2-like [Oryza brachyantha]XP_040378411.1 transcription factor MYC2-like [Oryza brachyantha]XP_040378412.1 transcription factor MYC2-like [Oryza brachyantha]XP_040378413.1 transcription factor MYC2-like [Oryza brachyantha]
MDDSSLFMEWAMETLQHLHSPPEPPAPGGYSGGVGDAFPSLQALRDLASQNGMAPPEPAAHEGHRASNSWSSGDTDSVSAGGGHTSAAAMEHVDGWSPSPNSVRCAPGGGGGLWPVSWNFSSAMTQPCNETTPNQATRARHGGGGQETSAVSPPTRRAASKGGGGTGPSSAAPYAQEHIIAERKRREKINQRFIELSTVIPGLKKMDKATILSDAVRYVKELQEKLSELEDQNGRSVESAVLVKKPCIAAAAASDDHPAAQAAAAGGGSRGRSSLPEIEAKISHGNVMVRIHCESGKGLVVRLLAAVEGLHLAITHTNVMPFPACTAIITIMAKVDDGFSVTAENIVGKLNTVLQQNSRNNNNTTAEETRSCQQQETAAS